MANGPEAQQATPENGSVDTPPGNERKAQIRLDDSAIQAVYANLCRVASTPEEVILDLALNPNPGVAVDQTLKVSQRVILNHYTAKRLAILLSAAVERHEKTFGPLEMDVRRRLVTEPTEG